MAKTETVWAAEEKEVLFAYRRWTDGVLDEVVVDFERTVFEVEWPQRSNV